MTKLKLLAPAALYARVISERQDLNLSSLAQLRILQDCANRNGYLGARKYGEEGRGIHSLNLTETLITVALGER
ncbi:MAG: hypothetical protein OXC99_01015 [Chloroflexi bacterium]|nr:hypothetical protein [Chloroflexota bacterium]